MSNLPRVTQHSQNSNPKSLSLQSMLLFAMLSCLSSRVTVHSLLALQVQHMIRLEVAWATGTWEIFFQVYFPYNKWPWQYWRIVAPAEIGGDRKVSEGLCSSQPFLLCPWSVSFLAFSVKNCQYLQLRCHANLSLILKTISELRTCYLQLFLSFRGKQLKERTITYR